MDDVRHRLGHAAGDGEAPARRRALVEGLPGGDGGEVHPLGLEHTLKLLEGEHEVHIRADVCPDGLQLFGGAGPHKDHLAAGVLLFHQPGGEDHGRQGHGDVFELLREQLLHHGVPRRAAGGGHKALLRGDLHQKVLRLLDGAHVRAHGHLHRLVEAQGLHGGGDLLRQGVLAELAHEGRGHDGHHPVPLHDGADHLKDLPLVHDGPEGAAHQALAAGYALVLVDDRPALLVGDDGVHAAGGGAGAFHVDDGVVGAGGGALAALDARIRVDLALAVDEGDGPLGADLLAGGGQAVLAELGDLVLLGGAGVAGVGDDVDKGRLVVGLGDGGLVHALGHQGPGLDGADGQAHGQPDPLAGDGPLQEDGLPVQGLVAGDDDVGQILGLGVVSALVGHAGHLGEDLFADVGNQGWNASHGCVLLVMW